MNEEERRKLEKEVKKTKRLAGEAAMELHDLIEDQRWCRKIEQPDK